MDPRSFLPKIGRIVRVLAEFDVKRFFEIHMGHIPWG